MTGVNGDESEVPAAVLRERRRAERARAPKIHGTLLAEMKARGKDLRDPTKKAEHWTKRWARAEAKKRRRSL
jgi:hypothetical protein